MTHDQIPTTAAALAIIFTLISLATAWLYVKAPTL